MLAAALTLLVASMGSLTMLDPLGNFIIILPAILGAIVGFIRASVEKTAPVDELAG